MDFMKRAIQLANENVNSGSGGPFGCVITRNGVIVAEAANSVTREVDPTAHAEVNALRMACKALNTIDLSECTVYSSCEPCPMCYSALRWANIDKIVYSSTREDAGSIGFRDDAIYNAIISGNQHMERVKVKSADEPFALWIRSTSRVPY